MSQNKVQTLGSAIEPRRLDQTHFYPVLKRLFDIVLAAIGLLLLLPVGLLIALFIKLLDGGPIFYTQIRIGQFGRSFTIRKFRSMVVNADKTGLPVTPEGDPRITWVGRLLRKTKLDELPQLWNVFIGDMSSVGPRPEVPRYVEAYTAEQREILKFKPGITDMATLLFRNEEALLRGSQNVEEFYVQHCLPRKIALNRQYALRASLAQDIWIIIQTLCPYWLGIMSAYGLVLIVSAWFSFQLRSDFQLAVGQYGELARAIPILVIPQIVLLMWRRQFRGLMSYFSIPEMRQTAAALGIALVLQLTIWLVMQNGLMPPPSLLVTHFMVSFLALCAFRMTIRSARERSSRVRVQGKQPPRRTAIVGAGELGTRLALDLVNGSDASREVVAFFDDDPRAWHRRPHDIPVVGMPECLLNREWLGELDEVIIALPEEASDRVREIEAMLTGSKLKVTHVSGWPLK